MQFLDFIKNTQTKWALVVFVFAIFGKIFGLYDNINTLWHSTKKIQTIQTQTQILEKNLCQSISLQKTIVISNASIFNAFLIASSNKDVQSIEIIKEMAKTQLENQIQELKKLIEKCNV